MSLRISVATEDLGSSLRGSLDAAARLKVDGVRLNARSEFNANTVSKSELRQILQYTQERQMKVGGLYCPVKHALYEEEFLEPRLDVIRATMSIARSLQTTEVLVRCGPLPTATPPEKEESTEELAADSFDTLFAAAATSPKKSPQAEHALLRELLTDLTRHGNHVGCTINLIVTGYDVANIRSLLNDISGGPLRIVFDPATAMMEGGNPESVFRQLHEDWGSMRARDAGTNLDGGGMETRLGDGNVNWLELIPTLIEADFPGWVCVERTGGDTRAADVATGVKRIRELLPQTEN
ncbi:MAG: sugar phosphate isomerase/epimerase [Planctomycetaceae bacterium]|nr:sugar phosphate isomerase/epimerase [Planctomycetaceae bacterium]